MDLRKHLRTEKERLITLMPDFYWRTTNMLGLSFRIDIEAIPTL